MKFTFYSPSASTKSYNYRNHLITRYKGGWVVTGDNNIYLSVDCASNAIDKKLGGIGSRGTNLLRKSKGITVIGTKE